MYDFERIKRQILDRVELLEVVSEQVHLKRSGRRWLGLCPFHSEKTPSFTVLPEQGLFKCFGCGKGGDLFSFVQLRENLPFMEVLQLLADRAGVEMQTAAAGPGTAARVDRPTLAKVNEWAADFFRKKALEPALGDRVRDYIRGRGFTDETASAFKLGLACEGTLQAAARRVGYSDAVLVEADLLRRDESGRYYETFRNRLMFPIRDATGRVIGFGGRTLGEDKAKYLNTRQTALFDKGRNLYGIERARSAITERGRAVLVEGYTDCIACHQAGVTEAVATLGTALTLEQIGILRRYGEALILLFDSDQAGEAAADRALRLALPACMHVRLARVPSGKDPAEFLQAIGIQEFTDVLNGAVDALEFKWLQTQQRFDAGASTNKRREAVLDFIQLIADASRSDAIDAIQRGLIVNQVAHLLRMDRGEVGALLGRFDRSAGGPKPAGRTSQPGQSAWVNVLEVGLNEPGLLAAFSERLDARCLDDEKDRRIAAALFDTACQSPDVQLADVLARLSDPADAGRVEELARRGAERGNFEATMEVAMLRIERTLNRDRNDESRETRGALVPVTAESTDEGPSEKDGPGLRGLPPHQHFAPARLIRRAVEAQIVQRNA